MLPAPHSCPIHAKIMFKDTTCLDLVLRPSIFLYYSPAGQLPPGTVVAPDGQLVVRSPSGHFVPLQMMTGPEAEAQYRRRVCVYTLLVYSKHFDV